MLYHEQSRSLLLKAEDPLYIRELLGKSMLLNHPDYNIAVKLTLESTRVLRNIGIQAPAPIQHVYNWPKYKGIYDPFDHQRVMAEFYTLHRRCFNLSEMGTGKTAATLWAADYMMHENLIRKVAVLSPISTMERVWMQAIFDTLMHRQGIVVHGSREQRLAALQANVDFYIVNHDGVKIEPVAKAIRSNPDINLVVVDEGSMFRNHDVDKFKALEKMLRPDQRVWWITGTPCPNEPTDAWAQCRIICPERVPKWFGTFKRATMINVRDYKWVPKPDAYNIVYDAMQPAIRFKKADCLDLPPVVTQERSCEITKEQRSAFMQMKNAMIAEARERQVTAANAADKVNKLRQILCGAIKVADGEYVEYAHKPRAALLKECIDLADAKVYVVVPFKGVLAPLKRYLDAEGYTSEIVNGDVPRRRRDQIFKDFTETPNPRVLLCHPKVMSHGLDFTAADVCIFYAPIYSNDEDEQVKERMNRAGQTRKMTIVRIGAHPIEWEVYRAVDSRKATQDTILNLYNSIIE